MSTRSAKTTKYAAAAFETLPTGLQDTLVSLGYVAGRIEESGALAMLLNNGMSLSEKQIAIAEFRKAARSYGLELNRVSMMRDASSLWDDGCLLVCAPDARGARPRLFNADGTPSDLTTGGASPKPAARRQRIAT